LVLKTNGGLKAQSNLLPQARICNPRLVKSINPMGQFIGLINYTNTARAESPNQYNPRHRWRGFVIRALYKYYPQKPKHGLKAQTNSTQGNVLVYKQIQKPAP